MGDRVGAAYGDARVIVGHRMKETVSLIYGYEVVRDLPLAEIIRYATSKN